jgi:hypothetical protein
MLWLPETLADMGSRETYVLVITATSITPLLLVPIWVALWSLLYRFFCPAAGQRGGAGAPLIAHNSD